eukprot:TRINITY_DN23921_c0_g1_i1.p1 TRINITY_DN23921_c0_g1~~TRINITY_DN23921_c0_g1_i1.p1  ORF type:complete len:805 (+),score=309.84 TRINITY_DN23921_c0_g1_i1:28-2415(+)
MDGKGTKRKIDEANTLSEGSSRLRVTGLPKDADQKRLKAFFAPCGQVTDCAIIRNKQNNRPRMAFLGFRSEEAAANALRKMNNTFLGTSKLTVEFAKQYGNEDIEKKAWSAHTKKKVAAKEAAEAEKAREAEEEEARLRAEKEAEVAAKKRKTEEVKDRNLKNFLEATKGTSSRKIWDNDLEEAAAPAVQGEESSDDGDASVASLDSQDIEERQNAIGGMSDMDFLKSKQGADKGKVKEKKEKETPKEGTPQAKEAPKRKVVRSNCLQIDDAPPPPSEAELEAKAAEEILETGRLYLTNLPFAATEEEVQELCSKYGTVAESHVPLTKDSKQSKGVAFIQFAIPEHAVEAYHSLKGTIFQGRLLNVKSGKPNPYEKEDESNAKSSYKKMKELKERAEQANPKKWNTLFMGANTVAEALAKRLNTSKDELVDMDTKDIATRLAMGEAHLTTEVREMFSDEGLDMAVLTDENRTRKRSDRDILVKNLQKDAKVSDITALFDQFGALEKVVAPKDTTIALVRFVTAQEAKVAFRKLAFRMFNREPLYLEWAPVGAIRDDEAVKREKQEQKAVPTLSTQPEAAQPEVGEQLEEEDIFDEGEKTLYVTNIAFSIQKDDFERFIRSAAGTDAKSIVAVKLPLNGKETKGFGFIQFKSNAAAKRALANLKGKTLMQRELNVEFAKEDKAAPADNASCPSGHDPLKLTVKNVPFEATREDIAKLFAAFSQVKSVRLPRKAHGASGTGAAKRPHRGFAFVEFTSPQEAITARNKLANTHLYGRHLVIEHAKLDDAVGARNRDDA